MAGCGCSGGAACGAGSGCSCGPSTGVGQRPGPPPPPGAAAWLAAGAPGGQVKPSECGNGRPRAPGLALAGQPNLPRGETPPGARRALLLPGGLGEVYLDGPVPLAAQLHQRLAAARGRPLPARGDVLGPAAGAVTLSPPASGRAPLDLTEAQLAGPPPAEDAGSFHASVLAARGRQPVGAILDIPINVQYGEVAYTIPLSWWLSYEAEGRGTSSHDALDWLWRGYRGAAESLNATTASLEKRLGCWNIDPSRALNGLRDDAFFQDSTGAKQYLLNAMRIAATYSDFAEEAWSGNDRCDGFPDFMRRLFTGREGTNRAGVKCRVKAYARSTDVRFDGEAYPACTADGPDFREACGKRYDSVDDSPRFDDWTPYWWEYWVGSELRANEIKYSSKQATPPIGTGASGGNADIAEFGIQFPAIKVAFDGYICDFLLYWCRVLMDYGRENHDARALWCARRIARWELANVAARASNLIHEAGHIWMGEGGHCCVGCCFPIASEAWLCRVSAALGLPLDPDYPRLDDGVSILSSSTACGQECETTPAGETEAKSWSSTYLRWCDVGIAEQPKQEAIFWASECEMPAECPPCS